MVNKKKGYDTHKLTINIRKTYYNHLKTLDISITDFLDKAIGKELDVMNKSDEWIYKQIDVLQNNIDSFKSLLTDRAKERQKSILINEKLQFQYEEFCEHLNRPGVYNTNRTNKQFNTNVKNYDHFLKLKSKHNNNKFTIKDFMKLQR